MRNKHIFLTVLLLFALAGCPDTTDISYDPDSGQDGENGSDDDGCTPQDPCANPVGMGCGTAEICQDGLDNNCDGQVDEGCTCTPGAVQSCFLGPPGFDGVGTCQRGHQTCFFETDYGYWGPCQGSLLPSAEVCDLADNDCNGCVDEDLCCTGVLDCPEPGDPRIPEAMPFYKYLIDGGDFYSGMASSWSWEVRGTPCDDLLWATTQTVSFEVQNAARQVVELRFRLSGDYTVTMTVRDAYGNEYSCTFVIHVKGPGLRVELCWDTTGDSDMDLHLHRPGTTTDWYHPNDDCYWDNCTGEYAIPDWGYPPTDLLNCISGPQGENWKDRGACNNPRLDIDNMGVAGLPENINVDNPREGDTFRVMVLYYSGLITTRPMVNIYCGGYLFGTYGAYPDVVTGFDNDTGEPTWRVVDVTTRPFGPNPYDVACDLQPLYSPNSPTDYWITIFDKTY